MKSKSLLVASAASFLMLAPSAQAAFTLFENFDALTTAPLSGQNGWTANSATSVFDASGDQVARVAAGATGNLSNYKGLGALSIPNSNSSTTVYFNLSFSASTGNNFNVILSDVAAPGNTAGDSEVQLNTDNSAPAGGVPTFRANSGGSFPHLTTEGSAATAVPLVADSLYNVWFIVNNVTDRYQIYMQNDSVPSIAAGPTLLSSTAGVSQFTFRNSGTTAQSNDLTTFNFGSGSATNTFQVDDIYVDLAGENLINPIPEPSVMVIAAVGALAGAFRRRRAI